MIFHPFVVWKCLLTSLVSVGHLETHGLFKIPSVASISALLMKSSGVGHVFVGM